MRVWRDFFIENMKTVVDLSPPLCMQRRFCLCWAAWPGRWSFPGCSCPVGGRGPTAPPELCLQKKRTTMKTHLDSLKKTPVTRTDWLLYSEMSCWLGRDKEDKSVKEICFWGIISRQRLYFLKWVWGDWHWFSVSTDIKTLHWRRMKWQWKKNCRQSQIKAQLLLWWIM